MTDAGLAKIEEANGDGGLDSAYTSDDVLEMPDDLLRALRRNRKALRDFEWFTNSKRMFYTH
jgi:uncharacterized protein YdeI (YjbR/CyaY-like superfamily)